MEDKSFQLRKCEEFLEGVLKEISDPIHRRLIQAYEEDNPVDSMESELRKILMEVLQRED
jgi:hypothetical protein